MKVSNTAAVTSTPSPWVRVDWEGGNCGGHYYPDVTEFVTADEAVTIALSDPMGWYSGGPFTASLGTLNDGRGNYRPSARARQCSALKDLFDRIEAALAPDTWPGARFEAMDN